VTDVEPGPAQAVPEYEPPRLAGPRRLVGAGPGGGARTPDADRVLALYSLGVTSRMVTRRF
jgi:hypothetical protein